MSLAKWTINILTVCLSICILIAVLAGATWLVLEQYSKVHQVNAAYQENAQYDRKKASEKIAQTCKLPNFIAFRKCMMDELETYYSDQATNEDLKAQKDMALWAFIMVAVSAFTALITLVGVWYVKNTLNATANAVKAANKTNEIMMKDQRPWLVIDSKFKGFFSAEEAKHKDFTHLVHWSVDFEIANRGKSAGTKFQLWQKMVCLDNWYNTQKHLLEFITETETKFARSYGVVFPKQSKPFDKSSYGELIKSESEESKYFAMFMILRYTDTSGELRGIDARCFVLQQIGPAIGPWITEFRADDAIRVTN